jgi:Fe-Mn family superoxide dismutase
MIFEPQKLNYKELDGISEKQLSEHHDVLYAGYVKKVNEIREKLPLVDKSSANGTYSDIRELKLEESFALNGVFLHELYFDNLGGDGAPTEDMEARLIEDFGSFQDWQEDLIACGISARGWVILAEDIDGTLRHFTCDLHSQGGIWGYIPILVLDVYEHAYFIDYGTNRKDYIKSFIKNIDWTTVENRLI